MPEQLVGQREAGGAHRASADHPADRLPRGYREAGQETSWRVLVLLLAAPPLLAIGTAFVPAPDHPVAGAVTAWLVLLGSGVVRVRLRARRDRRRATGPPPYGVHPGP